MVFAAWILVSLWIHRAATNLRGLGRFGMTFTPGWCVGWYFVPIAMWWMPVLAMSEIWRASDPQCPGSSWSASGSRTPLLPLWWTAWIVASLLSGRHALNRLGLSLPPATGYLTTGTLAIAAVALILIMRGVLHRQEAAARNLHGSP
jgi:hypothetical protein